MPDKPEIIKAIEEQRAKLLAKESDTMQTMAKRWSEVQDALRADELDLAMYLDELRLKGETISTARLMQMDRYKALIADARTEQTKYSAWASDYIAGNQDDLLKEGIVNGAQLLDAAAKDAGIKNLMFDRLNKQGVEFATGFTADGTPLYKLLRESYPESVINLTGHLVTGLATGKGPRATAAMMAEDMAGNLDRALLIAVTEQNRALRAASLDQMQSSKVIKGYIRRSQRNATVCGACLALDGIPMPSDEIFANHPRCHCFAQPVLRFGKTPDIETGPEWLARQPEATQLQVLGKGKFELLKQNKLDWTKMADIHNDPIWGPTVRQGLLADVKSSTVVAKKVVYRDVNEWSVLEKDPAWQDAIAVTQDRKNEEFQALQRYTRSGYNSMNEYLRQGIVTGSTGTSAEDIALIPKIDALFARVPPTIQDTTVIRGSGVDLSKLKPGTRFTDKAYVSTSTNARVSLEFMQLSTAPDKAIMVINVPTGSRVLPLGNGVFSPRFESEVLLNRDSIFEVDRIEKGPVKNLQNNMVENVNIIYVKLIGG